MNRAHAGFDKNCVGLEPLTSPLIPETDAGCTILVTTTCFHVNKSSYVILLSTSTTAQTPKQHNVV